MSDPIVNVRDVTDPKSLRVVCPDGIVTNAYVEFDGERIVGGVTRVEITLDAETGISKALLWVDMVELDGTITSGIHTFTKTESRE